MGWGTLEEVCWTLGEVRDGSGDPLGDRGRVGGPTGKSGSIR